MTRKLALVAALAVAAGAAPASAADPTLKIGALMSITGPASFLGAPEARTLEMLAEQLNAKGGVAGRKIELVIKDTGGSPEKAVSFAKQLIEEDQVFAIIGPPTSGETMQVKAIAEEAKVPLLSCAAAEAIVNPVARWVFKVAQKDKDAIGLIFAQMKKMKATEIAVLSSNTGFGKAGKDLINKLAAEQGIKIVMDETYDKAATDLTAEVTKVKASGAKALLNWSIEPAQSIVIKNARQIGLTIPIFQSHGFANINYVKAAGAAAEGVIFPASAIIVADSLPAKHPQKQLLLEYKKAYESRYKEDASAFGAYAHDAFGILVKALQEKGADREKVRDAIEATKGWAGASGVFNLSATDHNGLGPEAFEMVTVKDGKFVLLGK
jgi:branched-chain amino acid transport system substrate-binding protein